MTQAYNSLCSRGAAKQRFINEKVQNIITIIYFYITNLILFYIYDIINKNFGAKTLQGIQFFKYILPTSVNISKFLCRKPFDAGVLMHRLKSPLLSDRT